MNLYTAHLAGFGLQCRTIKQLLTDLRWAATENLLLGLSFSHVAQNHIVVAGCFDFLGFWLLSKQMIPQMICTPSWPPPEAMVKGLRTGPMRALCSLFLAQLGLPVLITCFILVHIFNPPRTASGIDVVLLARSRCNSTYTLHCITLRCVSRLLTSFRCDHDMCPSHTKYTQVLASQQAPSVE